MVRWCSGLDEVLGDRFLHGFAFQYLTVDSDFLTLSSVFVGVDSRELFHDAESILGVRGKSQLDGSLCIVLVCFNSPADFFRCQVVVVGFIKLSFFVSEESYRCLQGVVELWDSL